MRLHKVFVQDAEHAGAGNLSQRRTTAEYLEALLLAQSEQAGEMVDIRIGNEHRRNRRVPPLAARMQYWLSYDLLSQIRRGV